MATTSRFVSDTSFWETEELRTSPANTTGKRVQSHIQFLTNAEAREEYGLLIPQRKHSRPQPLRTISTPPDSPTRIQSFTTGTQDSLSLHDSGALTPPITPIKPSHSISNSESTDFLSTLSSLRRGDSTSSRTSPRDSLDMYEKPGSAETISFPYHLIDYEFLADAKGRKTAIGQGLWSDVYLAEPALPKVTEQSILPTHSVAFITPPLTPVHSRESSLEMHQPPGIPSTYAIKVPASTSAKKVLAAEAKILSYLSRFPDAEQHIVSFYGLDSRTGTLVLKAMDSTLESWIETELNTLDEASRAQNFAAVFPAIATSLIASLSWMQDKGCVHADIKPSNILVSSTSCSSAAIPVTVFSDFSSSILTSITTDTNTDTPSPLGAGTWDYLDPSLLTSLAPTSTPSATTDLWSLGITLLSLVIGFSPYDAFKHNKFQQREMIKAGQPLQCLGYSDEGVKGLKRVKALSGELGFDLQAWFGKVLVKDGEKRVGLGEWRGELERSGDFA